MADKSKNPVILRVKNISNDNTPLADKPIRKIIYPKRIFLLRAARIR